MSDLDELDPVLAGAAHAIIALCSLIIIAGLLLSRHEQASRPSCHPSPDPAIIKPRVCAP